MESRKIKYQVIRDKFEVIVTELLVLITEAFEHKTAPSTGDPVCSSSSWLAIPRQLHQSPPVRSPTGERASAVTLTTQL